ncbi:MAG TPA: hypothetical protein DC064_12595 [Cyanobacteria bacterium UBA9273]|nr:hypothetical protein [Cyanobacteria bacterium UBA9273]
MIHPNQLLQDRYRVLQKLGKGGFGQTFEVDDGGIRKVLKVLHLDRCHNQEAKQKAVSLFQREAAVLSRLHHPGIPKVEADGYFTWPDETDEPLHCLVMEKIDGLTLKQWRLYQGNRPIGQDRAIAWLMQLTQILEQLHQQELIHRDIKPSNILLRPNGQLVLIDFGAVREITETYLYKQKNDVTGTVIFSSGYTPPEQMEGHAVPQSDFFALGRTFVYLLTGKPPIDFDQNPRTGKLQWRDSAPQVSPELADLIDYLMAAFPGQRPQTPQMILRCIEDIVSPAPPLPPPPPIPEKPRSPTPEKPRSILALISSLLSSPTSPNAWEKVKLRRTLSGHTDVVRSIAISPDGQILVSGSYDKTIKLWGLRTGELHNTLTGHTSRITCIAISPDGQTLASGSYDKTIKLWELSTGKLIQTIISRPDRVRDIAFSPNGQTLISIGEWEIKLWAVRTGKLLRILAGNSDSARMVAFSPDGHTCAIGSLNGGLKLWKPLSGKLLMTFPSQFSSISALAFSPDGETLASGSSSAIQLWNPQNGKLLRTLATQSRGIASLVFTSDSEILASASGTNIELWHLQSGKRLGKLSGHSKPIRSLTFNPDGDILVSGAADQKIKIWQSV